MLEGDMSAMYYFAREANSHVTRMSLSANQDVIDFHSKCAHDAIDELIRLLSKD
jgi:hypothetical protein